MTHQLGSSEEVLINMYNSWRGTYGKLSQHLIQFLLQWGFLVATKDGDKLKLDSKLAARYVSAAAAAGLAAVLEERQKLEQEKIRGN